MRLLIAFLAMVLFIAPVAHTQTADEIIAKYVKTIGGKEKMKSVKSIVRIGKFIGGGGFEAPLRQENKRPSMIRSEFTMQNLTGVTAYDGKTGWKIEPWGGKKDVESLDEGELRGVEEDADFDGPLIDYKAKGNTVKFLGTEPVDGTDAYKLEIKMKSGDTHTYYMDTDYYVPIKIEIKRTIRGNESEFFINLGDYKEVNGVYYPFFQESGSKGSQFTGKTAYEKIEVNIPLADDRFLKPVSPVIGK